MFRPILMLCVCMSLVNEQLEFTWLTQQPPLGGLNVATRHRAIDPQIKSLDLKELEQNAQRATKGCSPDGLANAECVPIILQAIAINMFPFTISYSVEEAIR